MEIDDKRGRNEEQCSQHDVLQPRLCIIAHSACPYRRRGRLAQGARPHNIGEPERWEMRMKRRELLLMGLTAAVLPNSSRRALAQEQ